ncbi:MAG: hypothetical protein U9N42_02920 [Campylobacterota bacterium]|nr:hypothetical protein [Campylobacterota bacterium]
MIFIIIGIIGLLYTYSSIQDVAEQKEKLEKAGYTLEEVAQSVNPKMAQMAQDWLHAEKGNDILLTVSFVMIIFGVLAIIYQKKKAQ